MMTRVKAISVGSTHDTCTPQSDRKKAPNIHDDCDDEDDFEQRDSRIGALFACLNIFSSCSHVVLVAIEHTILYRG